MVTRRFRQHRREPTSRTSNPIETCRDGGRSILTTITTSEAGTSYPRLGFAHRERAPIVFVVVESLDRSLSLGVGVHLDKTEPLATSHITVLDDLGALHGAVLGEPPLLQIGVGHGIAQISNVQFLSHEIIFLAKLLDPLNAFWVDEKGARLAPKRWDLARGGKQKTRFDATPRCSLSRQTNPLKYKHILRIRRVALAFRAAQRITALTTMESRKPVSVRV